jgi:hypothetical protein
MDLLDLLLDHDRWATRRLLEASGGLTEAQWDRPIDAWEPDAARDVRAHSLQRPVLDRAPGRAIARGRTLARRPADRPLAGGPKRPPRAATRPLRRSCVGCATGGRLEETFAEHHGVRKSVSGTVLMVVGHSEEHRTKVLHIPARLGVPDPPEVDLGVWEYLRLNT